MERITLNGQAYDVIQQEKAKVFPALVRHGNPKEWYAYHVDVETGKRGDIVVIGTKTKRECIELLKDKQS